MELLKNLSELQQRLVTGIIGASLMLYGIYWSEWAYFVIFLLISFFTLLEFYKLVELEDGNYPLKTFGTLNGVFLFVLTFLIVKFNLSPKYFVLFLVSMSGAFFIKLYVKTDIKPFANIAFTFLGIIYVSLPYSLMNLAVFNSGEYQFDLVFGTLFILWANDTGAYFSGKNFGRRKLFQRISPKKTWEGSIGGAVFALFIAALIGHFLNGIPLWKWFVIALIIVVAGTYGDLVESLFKRSLRVRNSETAGIKDSGNSLPGHGGFLDRFDSFMLSMPFIVAFVILF
jgi:phosphatidate cytidylyltransferase